MSHPLNWDLNTLLPAPGTSDFCSLWDTYRTSLQELADRSDSLPPLADCSGTDAWGKFLADYERAETTAGDLRSGIGCYAADDAENVQIQQLEAAISALDPLRERIAANVEFAFQEIDAAGFDAWLARSPEMRRIEYFLRLRRRNAQFRLPKEQELLAADLGVDGIHAWGRLFDRLSGSLKVKVMERGEIVEKSPGQIRFDVPDRGTRENNFFAADRAWKTIEGSCADALNHITGTRLTIYKRLGLRDHFEAPLNFNRMRRETLEAMWSAVSDRKPMLVDYCRRKANLIGLDQLSWWDVTAPLPATSSGVDTITYDDACEQIFSAFEEFTSTFGGFARMAVGDRWIEAEDRKGKRQGGFCTGFPGKRVSRIFMTYTNTADSMSTLAHELGHAYHSHVLRDEPMFLQDYPMNLAETASTFAEAVLGNRRLRTAPGSDDRLQILDGMLGDAVIYLMNIHCRFIFEDRINQERPNGELSPDQFSELMVAAQKTAFANCLADGGWNGRFWASKLHFYMSVLPFYNFPYTFGYLLSLGLFALAGERGPAFAEQYDNFLLATGAYDTEQAVQQTVGYDLTTPDFWHKSLDIVEQRVKEFLALTDGRVPA